MIFMILYIIIMKGLEMPAAASSHLFYEFLMAADQALGGSSNIIWPGLDLSFNQNTYNLTIMHCATNNARIGSGGSYEKETSCRSCRFAYSFFFVHHFLSCRISSSV